MWAFRIGLAYIFVKFFNLPVLWVWIAMSFDWIFRLIMFVTRMKGNKWMKYKKKSEKSEA